ncbi:hypothetical protein ACGFZQ_00385 [Streptomyces sp. NPDC048254]|uniref:hypothetical protein n=1 Tax=Streptomyces sp. NPDC048254 TaxID=3365525 RepID=UPI00370F7AFD
MVGVSSTFPVVLFLMNDGLQSCDAGLDRCPRRRQRTVDGLIHGRHVGFQHLTSDAGEHPAAHKTCESVEEHVLAHPDTGRMPIGPVLGLRREPDVGGGQGCDAYVASGTYVTPTDPDLLLAHIS